MPIDIIVEPPAEQEIEKGDIVNLTVLATSDALYPVSYEWIFKNKTYEGPHAPPNVTYDPVTKMAYINTTNLSEKDLLNIEGLYRRFVFNQIQSRTVDVVVTLKKKPPGEPLIICFGHCDEYSMDFASFSWIRVKFVIDLPQQL